MQLRRKFGWLALIYVLSLTVNLIMSGWCIAVYFQSAFESFESELAREQEIESLRGLLSRQREILAENEPLADRAQAYERIERRLSEAMTSLGGAGGTAPVNEVWSSLQAALARKRIFANQWFDSSEPSPDPRLVTEEDHAVFADIDALLVQAGEGFRQRRQLSVARAIDTYHRVGAILLVNTGVGVALCILGLFFVRRWVVHPIADLREAAQEIGQGNLDHRIIPRSRDELGDLAREVNEMAATTADLQARLIEQERLAAAGEMVGRLAHNIRNPLAGIRGLAEATVTRHADDTETVDCQQRIIDTVDRFEKWLHDLQASVSPLELRLKPTAIRDLIEQVVTALQPMLRRREVDVTIDIDPRLQLVRLDGMHFEQALVALVTNAVQASVAGQTVRIEAKLCSTTPGRWELSVRDEGAGIRPELVKKIFVPYFTTKPGGNGLGLAMANKVVRIHGGRLTVDSEPGHGSRFVARMPGVLDGNEAESTRA